MAAIPTGYESYCTTCGKKVYITHGSETTGMIPHYCYSVSVCSSDYYSDTQENKKSKKEKNSFILGKISKEKPRWQRDKKNIPRNK